MAQIATQKIDAYWFAASDTLPHGDARKIIIGESHSVSDGPLIICERGLHASRSAFDALQYAPGPYLYKVRCWGDIQEQSDKLVCRHREYIAMRDATPMLRAFARECALSVAHLWDAPDVVLRYLRTGDEGLRAAAEAEAAWAAWTEAEAAAWARESQRQRFAALVAELFEVAP